MSETSAVVLEATGVTRLFDVSRPWLQRVLVGEKRRHLRAVDDVSFAIPRGTTLALVGESGCGKSTVARLAVGLYGPSSGDIRFEGQALSAARSQAALRRRMNMIFQDPYASLNPRWRRPTGRNIRMNSRAASGSASRSHGRCPASRISWCATSRPRRWMCRCRRRSSI